MKTAKIFLSLFSTAAILVSCENQLIQSPLTDKSSNAFYSNQTEVEEAVIGAYASLQSVNLYGEFMPALGEISSDNTFDQVPANDNGYLGQLDQFTTNSSNGVVSVAWQYSYIGIQRANVVLDRIGNVSYTVDSIKTARMGEMKFIRALLYFNLVRLFGDVPLVTTETKDPTSSLGQGRTTSDLVYAQIKQDLTESISQSLSTATQAGRVTKDAARGLLARVYLTLGDFANAEPLLYSIVNSGRHSIDLTPANVFSIANANSNEMIFSVQFSSGVNGNTEGSIMYQQFSPSGSISGAKGHNLPTAGLYNLYTTNDLRKDAYVKVTSSGVPYCNKLVKPTTVLSDGGSNFVIVRYADVLLMLAEVENELGKTTQAVSYLNLVRARAGLANATAVAQADLRVAIDLERRLELVGEGHRWFDLLRTNSAISTMNNWFSNNNIKTTIDIHNLLLPVPIDQTNTDPSIKQNPGY